MAANLQHTSSGTTLYNRALAFKSNGYYAGSQYAFREAAFHLEDEINQPDLPLALRKDLQDKLYSCYQSLWVWFIWACENSSANPTLEKILGDGATYFGSKTVEASQKLAELKKESKVYGGHKAIKNLH